MHDGNIFLSQSWSATDNFFESFQSYYFSEFQILAGLSGTCV